MKYSHFNNEIYSQKRKVRLWIKIAIPFLILAYIGYKLYTGFQIAKAHNFYQIPDFSQIPQEIQKQEKQKECEKTLKELQINNTCEEVKKIIEAFNGDKTMVMIIMHESNFNRLAVYKNKNGSEDRGVFQLNSKYWGNVNGDIDYSISKAKQCYNSLGYNCWVAYKNGAYKIHEKKAETLLNNI